MLREGPEGDPNREGGIAGPVSVPEGADFLPRGGQGTDQGLDVRKAVTFPPREDPEPRSEAVEHATEVLPVMVHPVAVASHRIGHVDQAAAHVFRPVLFRELPDLPFRALPLVLRVEDEALDRPSVFLLKTPGQ